MLESLFNKVAGLQTCNFFKNTYFEEHLQTAAFKPFTARFLQRPRENFFWVRAGVPVDLSCNTDA